MWHLNVPSQKGVGHFSKGQTAPISFGLYTAYLHFNSTCAFLYIANSSFVFIISDLSKYQQSFSYSPFICIPAVIQFVY